MLDWSESILDKPFIISGDEKRALQDRLFADGCLVASELFFRNKSIYSLANGCFVRLTVTPSARNPSRIHVEGIFPK